MLRSVKEIMNYVLSAEDGEIGRCKDFLFDDEFWTIRYMVADTGKWLSDRKVLISPISLGEPDWLSRRFFVNLTREGMVRDGLTAPIHAGALKYYREAGLVENN